MVYDDFESYYGIFVIKLGQWQITYAPRMISSKTKAFWNKLLMFGHFLCTLQLNTVGHHSVDYLLMNEELCEVRY